MTAQDMGGVQAGLPGLLESVILTSVPMLPRTPKLPMPSATYDVCLVGAVHHFGHVSPWFLLQQHLDTNVVHELMQLLSVDPWQFPKFCLLSNHNPAGIRKQKYIGTRKHNSEAVGEAKHKHVTKDSDGSTRDVFPENI